MILWSAAYLESKGVARARLDAEYLLAHVLELDRLQLYLQFERPLTPAELDGVRPLLKRRARREPLQYVLGTAAFRDLELHVDERVLIPRPETEELVDRVLAWMRERRDGPTRFLDVGTGSGAIAVSLASEQPNTSGVASDVSADALAVARRNAEPVSDSVDLRLGSLYEAVRPGEVFDVVVANPPYVRLEERIDLAPEVLNFEPDLALFAGPTGLAVLTPLIQESPQVLAPGGLLALEFGADQGAQVRALAEAVAGLEDVRICRDLSGRDRILLAHRTRSDAGSATQGNA